SVNPPATALAGITEITITGSNFSTIPENNFVQFNNRVAKVLSATSTSLTVKAPNYVKDTVYLFIGGHKVANFSDSVQYSLKAGVADFYAFKDFEHPYAITNDNNNLLYFSLVADNIAKGINTVSGGLVTNFAPKGGETFYNAIKYGPNDKIYGVRGVRAIFEITKGAAPATYAVAASSTVKFYDLDFDVDKNMWAGGDGGSLFRIKLDKSLKQFNFTPVVNSLRIYDGYLYVATGNAGEAKIRKMQIINADSLGAEEIYFDFSANFPLTKPTAITFSSDGVLYIGTNAELINDKALIAVNPDKTFKYVYTGLINGPVLNFAWGTGNNLYYSRQKVVDAAANLLQKQMIVRVDLEKTGAPYYGRGN
ncbi:MAG: IPT/TIG domain-containing protein, partial [Bacteroidetes bacterium]|nr:IPT/TIG domain-containing protein [Bacteroidota bacterium]